MYICTMKLKGVCFYTFLAVLLVVPQYVFGGWIHNIDSIDRLYVKNADSALKQIKELGEYCEKTGWKTCSRSRYHIVYSYICGSKQMAPQNLNHAFAALECSISENDTANHLMALELICDIYADMDVTYNTAKYAHEMFTIADGNSKWSYYISKSKVYQAAAALASGRPLNVVIKYLNEADDVMKDCTEPYAECNRNIVRWATLMARADACQKRGRYDMAYHYLKMDKFFLDSLKAKTKQRHVDLGMDDSAFDLRTMKVNACLCLPSFMLGKQDEAEKCFDVVVRRQRKYSMDVGNIVAMASYLEKSRQWIRLSHFLHDNADYGRKSEETIELMKLHFEACVFLNDKPGEMRFLHGIENLSDTLRTWRDMYAEEEMEAVAGIQRMKSTIGQQQKEIKERQMIAELLSVILILTATIITAVSYFLVRQRRDNRYLYHQVVEMNQEKRRLLSVISTPEVGSDRTDGKEEDDKVMDEKSNLTNETSLVRDVKEYLLEDGNYTNCNIAPTDIAAHFNVTRQTLDKTMKNVMGITASDFITDLRLNHSCHLLENTNDTIYSIALDAGFSSERTFMRVFKQKYNITPTTYRNVGKKVKADDEG